METKTKKKGGKKDLDRKDSLQGSMGDVMKTDEEKRKIKMDENLSEIEVDWCYVV